MRIPCSSAAGYFNLRLPFLLVLDIAALANIAAGALAPVLFPSVALFYAAPAEVQTLRNDLSQTPPL
jgi:hypothetical protein